MPTPLLFPPQAQARPQRACASIDPRELRTQTSAVERSENRREAVGPLAAPENRFVALLPNRLTTGKSYNDNTVI